MIAQAIYDGLVARGMPPHVAEAAVQNMRAESNLNPGINEISPVVPGSRGGYGLNQWTGPRRRQYEAFAAAQGKPVDDLGTQLDFTVWELQNTEKKAGDALYAAPDAATAAQVYETQFLRPGIPHGGRGKPNALDYASAPEPADQAPQNALEAPRPRFQYNALQLSPYRMT